MKNVKRVFSATRGKWVKIICRDEPARKELSQQFKEIMETPARLPEQEQQQKRSISR